MEKEKVVSFNFYINEKVTPKTIIKDDDLEKVFPLYVTVTFNRKNTQFRVVLNDRPVYINDLKFLSEGTLKEKIDDYLHLIEIVVKEESKQLKDKFTLAGLGKRLKIYQMSISDYTETITLGSITKGAQNESQAIGLIQALYRIMHYAGFISVFDFMYHDWRNEDYLEQVKSENQEIDTQLAAILKEKLKDGLR